MDISIIVPVFNVADYIDECLQSLVDQSFSGSMEVVLIEDESPDNGLQKCEAWVERRPDIFKLLKNAENQGVSVSRNRGLEVMTGEYFTFVDPDDVVPPDAMEALYRAAEDHQADIIKGNNTQFNLQGERLSRYSVKRTETVLRPHILPTLFLHEKIRGHIWAKLFRSETMGQFRLTPDVRMAQDLLYMSAPFAHARTMVLLDKTVYRYRKHSQGSTGSKFRKGSYKDWIRAVEDAGHQCRSEEDRRAHRNLQYRSIAQLTRECAGLPADEIGNVLPFIVDLQSRWRLDLGAAFQTDIKSVFRYLKYRSALRKARQKAG